MLLIAVLSLAALSFVMFHTRIGLAIRCCSFDIKAAKLMGINPDVVINYLHVRRTLRWHRRRALGGQMPCIPR